ncbi:hypothetical protein ZWY2020_014638 [Hordeum vulgare]|nr:hypothetical protein ZWY2020_014638 [Hordeum vulgare]
MPLRATRLIERREPRHHRRVWRSSRRFVALLSASSTAGKKGAHHALPSTLSACEQNILSTGAVVPLVHLIGERGTGTSEKTMVVLASLANIADGRDVVVEAGGIPALVETIEDGPEEKEFVMVALLQLCSECSNNHALLVREGAIMLGNVA